MAAQDHESVWSALRELFGRLSARRRRQFYFVLTLMIAGVFAELATIGAVLPFLSLLADPHRTDQLPMVARAFAFIGAVNDGQRLFAAAGLFILLAIASGIVRLQLSWSSHNFVFQIGHDLALDIQRRLLFQAYSFHISHNSSSLIAALDKVGVLVFYVILQLMQAVIATVLSIFIVAALVYVDSFTALIAAAAFSLIYVWVSALSRRRLVRDSRILGSSWDERVKIVQESLGGIRDVLIDQSQAIYLDSFRAIDSRFAGAKASSSFLATAPRFVIESLGMVLIAVLAMVMAAQRGGLTMALPILGAFALGAQRLLPLLQQIYVSWSAAVSHNAIMAQVLNLLRLPIDGQSADAVTVAPLALERSIRFEEVSFIYPKRRSAAVENVNFEIRRGQRIALVGPTGSGKSTLADVLMGLLEPAQGRITIDGMPLTHANIRRWQRSIAHVPQAIFLADTTIARNIAIGMPEESIDFERVIEASRKAQLHEFVSALPEGYETRVGERGIQMSGGQRQRLGIARAIYKHASVLVLDEATNALDEATEAAVMDALDELGEDGVTIIMIAHRASTIARVDRTIRLDNGRVVEIADRAALNGGVARRRVS